MADVQSGTGRQRPSKERSRHGDGPRWGHWPASEPRTFGPPLAGVDGMSALPVRASLAFGEASFDLFTRQTQAASDYWKAVSAARAPWDVVAANSEYWRQFYRNLLVEADRAFENRGPDQ